MLTAESVFVSDVSVNEADSTADFTITADFEIVFTGFTVSYSTADNTAVAGQDYTADSGTLNFDESEFATPGSIATRTVSIPLLDGGVVEATESFYLNITSVRFVSDPQGEATITDNDAAVFTIDDATATEGGDVDFTVALDTEIDIPVTIDVTPSAGTAAIPADLAGTTVSVTFPANSTAPVTASISTVDDLEVEDDEDFSVALSINAGTDISDRDITNSDSGTGTIEDNDDPIISIDDVTVNEADGTATLTVSLDQAPLSRNTTVDYTTTTGTAGSGDFTATSGTLSFTGAETSKTITVSITNDGEVEETEEFTVDLSNPVSATIADASGTITIEDNDDPSISIDDVTVNEGDGTATFTVSLDQAPLSRTTTVDFATSDGSADSSDYSSTSGTLSFTGAETSKTITVSITDDSDVEDDETFTVTLSNAASGSISDATGTGTIEDNDDPSISIDDVTVDEGDGTATFTVSLDVSPLSRTTSVDYATSSGTATSGDDFDAASGTLTFTGAETSKTITITITDDPFFEANETFTVGLSNAVSGVIADSSGTGTIEDNDVVSVTIADLDVAEKDRASFSITLSDIPALDVTVYYSTIDGTATVADGDYNEVVDRRIVFPANDDRLTRKVSIQTNDDALVENSPFETFSVMLTGVENALITDDTGVATIIDDDATDLPEIVVSDTSVYEGGSLSFEVSLVDPVTGLPTVATHDVRALFFTTDGTASNVLDYTGTTRRTVTIRQGNSSGIARVSTSQDSTDELPSEDMTITLFEQIGPARILSQDTATGTIIDDDDPTLPVLRISDGIGFENGTVRFTVDTIDPVTGDPVFPTSDVTFRYSTTAGTATSEVDFTPADMRSGRITAARGTTTLSIPIPDDALDEGDETFEVTIHPLSNVGPVQILSPHNNATGTIINDDDPGLPFLRVTDAEGFENGTIRLTVDLVDPATGDAVLPTHDVNITYSTPDGTATGDVDFTAATERRGRISAIRGTTTITIPITDDDINEGDEDFTVTILSSSGPARIVTGGPEEATATILNDEDPALPFLRISDTIGFENGTARFDVELIDPATGDAVLPTHDVIFKYSTSDGTAESATDYTEFVERTGRISASRGSTRLSIPLTDDDLNEGDETFTVSITSISGPVRLVGGGEEIATGTIENDDDPTLPFLRVGDAIGYEGGFARFLVEVIDPATGNPVQPTSDVSFRYETSDGTATGDVDYLAVSNRSGRISASRGTAILSIPITQDALDEADETFSVVITSKSGPVRLEGAEATGEGTIPNDDDTSLPFLRLSDASGFEGGFLIFDAELIDPATGNPVFPTADVSFKYSTSDGSATGGDVDYTTLTDRTGRITVSRGSTTVRVPVSQDALAEGIEDFVVTAASLTGPARLVTTGTDHTATGSILEDDSTDLPVIRVSDAEGFEGGTARFTVDLVDPTTGDVVLPTHDITLAYSTTDDSATGDSDYTSRTERTVRLTAARGKAFISIPLLQDTDVESPETFTLTVVDRIGPAQIVTTAGENEGTGTVQDDDDPNLPFVRVSDAFGYEGGTAKFTVELVDPTTGDVVFPTSDVTVRFDTSDGTAAGGADYTSLSNRSARISASRGFGTITVPVSQDALNEGDETFDVTVTSSVGPARLVTDGSETATATIIDDDVAGLPEISISDVTAEEGRFLTFEVILSEASAHPIVVSYTMADGTATGGSSAPADYRQRASRITFKPGVTLAKISVQTFEDTDSEGDETFTIDLTAGSVVGPAVLSSSSTATGTIIDNDAAGGGGGGGGAAMSGGSGGGSAAMMVAPDPVVETQLSSSTFASAMGTANSDGRHEPCLKDGVESASAVYTPVDDGEEIDDLMGSLLDLDF